jgi:hypothetical protein
MQGLSWLLSFGSFKITSIYAIVPAYIQEKLVILQLLQDYLKIYQQRQK